MSRVAARALSAGRLGAGGGAGPPRRPHRHPLLCPHHRRRERHQAPCAVRESGVTPTRARRPSPPTRRFARLAPFPANPARASRTPRATSASDAADDEKKTDASSSSSRAASTAAGFDAVRVESLTVAQLRAVLRSRGARVGGNKSELAARVAAGGRSPPTRSSLRRARRRRRRRPPRRRSGGGSSAAAKPPPVLRWEVTDPPLPPRAPRLANDVPGVMRVLSWNVNGIRALLAKDPDILDRVAREENADVFVLQETKIQAKQVDEIDARVLAMYPHRVWNCSTARLGYSGTALFSREAPLNAWTDPFVATAAARDGGGEEKVRRARASRRRSKTRAASWWLSSRACSWWVHTCPTPGRSSSASRPARTPGTRPWRGTFARSRRRNRLCTAATSTSRRARSICGATTARTRQARGSRHRSGTRSRGTTSATSAFVTKKDNRNRSWTRFAPRTRRRRRTRGSPTAAARAPNRGWRIDYVLASDTPELVVHDAYIRGDVGGSDHCPVGAVFRLVEGGNA